MGLMKNARVVSTTNASWQIHWQQTAEVGFSDVQQEFMLQALLESHHYFPRLNIPEEFVNWGLGGE